METIEQVTKRYAKWIIECFASENIMLNYSLESLKHFDKFLSDNVTKGIPNPGGILNKNHDEILFGMGIYLGETFRKNIPGSKWDTQNKDGKDFLTGAFILPNNTCVFPLNRVKHCFENGEEDSIFPYALIVVNQMLKDDYWDTVSHVNEKTSRKPWWKCW